MRGDRSGPDTSGLSAALGELASRDRIAVGVDFDGTLAPFVVRPMDARPLPGGTEALRALAQCPGVTVAVVSGRQLEALAELTGIRPGERIVLIGSHGAEWSTGHDDASLLDATQRNLLAALTAEAEAIVTRHEGARLEHKPAAVAVHTRGLPGEVSSAALRATAELADRYPGAHPLPGKEVLELSVLTTGKGNALTTLAKESGADATCYLGDDVTDERAFAALDPAGGDVTIKVGEGDTAAAFRVGEPADVVGVLRELLGRRSR
ncbi:MAG TPA: trehalose-phosphatase [Segeticoccus sp.]|nr:trehalose-phosphatase [Segeticoccus sp.]